MAFVDLCRLAQGTAPLVSPPCGLFLSLTHHAFQRREKQVISLVSFEILEIGLIYMVQHIFKLSNIKKLGDSATEDA